ncbi:19542_t:CDS:2 [Entrophospora sp. SA101]|nr:19542_t:CDS:2 [Entrophospora sp. SA101]
MEAFFVSYTPISDINIATALYKRIEAGVWTYEREDEIKNFMEVLENALNIVSIDDDERLRILNDFGTGDALKTRKVEPSWVADAIENFNALKRDVHKGRDKASSASAKRKGSSRSARRPDFSVIVGIKGNNIEIGYLETGRPDSTTEKQWRDHKKLNRLSKDSIDYITSAKKQNKIKGIAIRNILTIFTINVTGTVLEFRCMNKEYGIYKSCLLECAPIPLSLSNADAENVYQLIHVLLSFRTRIICVMRKMLLDKGNIDENDSDDTRTTVSTP